MNGHLFNGRVKSLAAGQQITEELEKKMSSCAVLMERAKEVEPLVQVHHERLVQVHLL